MGLTIDSASTAEASSQGRAEETMDEGGWTKKSGAVAKESLHRRVYRLET